MKVRLLMVTVLVATALAVAGDPVAPEPAAAQPWWCQPSLDPNGNPRVPCPTDPDRDTTPPGDPNDPGGGEGGTWERPYCVWQVWAPLHGANEAILRSWHPAAPDEVTWWWRNCDDGCNMPVGSHQDCGTPDGSEDPVDSSWTVPIDAPPGTPGEVYLLELLWVEVHQIFDDPEPATDPPLGESAVVHLPTFVEVTNLTDAALIDGGSLTECLPEGAFALCVTLEWGGVEMTFDPGDGAPAIPCDPPGSRFDPTSGASVAAQADGACAHSYTEHTAGRSAHQASVSLTWQPVIWYNDREPPWTGEFDPMLRSASFDREIDELQSVVQESAPGSGGGR